MIDRDLSPVAALERSGAMTEGVKGILLVFGFVLGLFQLSGILALGVGMLVTIPVSIIAYAHVYRLLLGNAVSAGIPSAREPQSPPPAA